MFAIPAVDRPATEKQIAFVRSLIDQKLVGDAHETALEKMVDMLARDAFTMPRASAWIERLKNMPNANIAAKPEANDLFPAGRYAVMGEDGVMKFYKVDRPCEGKWAGYTFLKVQAGDDFHAVKGAAAKAILAKIAADPQAAMLAYGKLIGVCGACGRTLTDPVSRAMGIGPVCRERFGIVVPSNLVIEDQEALFEVVGEFAYAGDETGPEDC